MRDVYNWLTELERPCFPYKPELASSMKQAELLQSHLKKQKWLRSPIMSFLIIYFSVVNQLQGKHFFKKVGKIRQTLFLSFQAFFTSQWAKVRVSRMRKPSIEIKIFFALRSILAILIKFIYIYIHKPQNTNCVILGIPTWVKCSYVLHLKLSFFNIRKTDRIHHNNLNFNFFFTQNHIK